MFKHVSSNKGSALVMLMIIMSILMLLGSTILTISVTNFNFKIINSKAKRNFYLAEAGLDEAINIMRNLILEAIDEGNKAVEEFIANLDLENSEFIKEDGTLDIDALYQVQDQLFKDTYKEYIKNNIENKLENADNYTIELDEIKPVIRILNENLKFSMDKLEIDIESTYIKDEIEKKVKISLVVGVPNYNEPIYISSNTEEIFINTVWGKAIATNGNIVLDSTNTEINGDIYTKGQDNTGGLILRGNNIVFNINGNIITKQNFKINSSNNIITTNGDIFAKNLIISEGTDSTTINHNLGSIYLIDDLELNGSNCQVSINNFYGISDSSDAPNPDMSSSIIINTDDIGNGTSLNINGDVIIYGTSFINTYVGKYQTGESISIKGNYIAYTYPLHEFGDRVNGQSLKSDNVVFEYYDPLVLVDSFKDGKKLTVFDKSDYIKFYHDEYKDSSNLNLGQGITINGENIIHSGAIVYNGNVIPSNFIADYQGIINDKKEIFNTYVDKMGDESIQLDKITVTDQVDYSKIKENIESYKPEKKELIILNNDNEDYAIIGLDKENINLPSGINKITLSDKNINGLIITKGNIYFLGKINFNGTIITTGNIYIYDSNEKVFNNNKQIVAKLIYENSLKDIFRNNSNRKITIESNIDIGNVEKGNMVYIDDLLTFKNWEVIR